MGIGGRSTSTPAARTRERLVAVAVAVGWEGSKRSVVVAAGVMAVQRKRWIRTGAIWAV